MMNKTYKTLLIVLSVFFSIVALSTPHWSEATIGNVEMSAGLWNTCMNQKCDNELDQLPPDNLSAIKATRAFSVSALIFLSVGLLCCSALQDANCSKLFVFLGGLCALISLATWNSGMMKISMGGQQQAILVPGYSFYMSMLSGVIALIAVGMDMDFGVASRMGWGY